MQMLKGVVKRDGRPVAGAYVRLLAPSGDFASEHRTRDSGSFRFHVVPGTWTITWMVPGGRRGQKSFEVSEGQVLEVEIPVD